MVAKSVAIPLMALVAVQLVVSSSYLGGGASAQSEQGAIVFRVYTGRDVCEVQYRRSDDDNWGPQTLDGPPVACSGGMVHGEFMSLAEANAEVAKSSATSSSAGEIIVPLSGNETEDDAAITAAVQNLHDSVETADPEAESEVVSIGSLGLGYLSPDALSDEQWMRPSILAAECNSGRVGQKRRADFKIDARNQETGYGTYVTGKIT